MHRHLVLLMFSGVSFLALASQAVAQEAAPAADDEVSAVTPSEIIVSARRRLESVQDVPQTVNVVTGAQLEKLNLRNFTEIQAVVPGLQLQSTSAFNNTATVRGIAFVPGASGNNPSVEFYLNDAPISSNFLFKTMFDLGQFELQRGPQGTLRGRASPSGSIAVTTRRPILDEAGVVINGTFTDLHAHKLDGAFNIPIIKDVLGIRLAGVIDNNRRDRVRSLAEAQSPNVVEGPYSRTEAIRASVRFEPADWASFNFMYQNLHAEDHFFQQVVSESLINPAAPAPTTTIIRPFDRSAIDEQGNYNRADQKVYTGSADFRAVGQKLSYVFSFNNQDFGLVSSQDSGNFFSPARGFSIVQRPPTDLPGLDRVCGNTDNQGLIQSTGSYGQCTHSSGKRESHELRLASEERIGGIFDYVVGAFYDHNETPSNLTQETPVVSSLTAPTRLLTVVRTGVLVRGTSTEKSFFGNIGAHLLDDRLEISGGLRYIDYKNQNALYQSSSAGTVACAEFTAATTRCNPPTSSSMHTHATIYLASAKFKITRDVMVYAMTGSSWRPGPRVVGDFSLGPNRQGQTVRELFYTNLPPERSKSYEIGVKTEFLNGRGRFNISAYHQTFQNYPFYGPQTFYISTNATGVESVATANNPGAFGFVSPVPVTVNGVEAELSYEPLKRWNLALNASYADGRIKNGTIACTDLNRDGIPDRNAQRPDVATLKAALGAGQTVGQCSGVNRASTEAPKFSANVQSDFDFDVGRHMDGFVRGLYSFYGKTSANPDNAFDDVGAYGLLNLYAGLRDKEGRWEISVFGKNITQEQKILTATGSPAATSLQLGATGTNFVSEYRLITVTAPREFGVNFRMALGSR